MTHHTRRQFSRLCASWALGPLALATLGTVGCNSLDLASQQLTTSAATSAAATSAAATSAAATSAAATNAGTDQASTEQAAAAPHTQCSVELRSEGRKPTRVAVLLDQETHVQDALVKSGAIKKYRRMNIELYRRTPAGKSHKMAVAYDSNKRQVEFQNDYFLKPNDVLVVTEDTSNMFDDMLRKASGNLPMLQRKS